MVLLGVIYSGVNYAATIMRGKPLYHFLAWDSVLTYIIVVALLILGVGIFIGVCKTVNWLKSVNPHKNE